MSLLSFCMVPQGPGMENGCQNIIRLFGLYTIFLLLMQLSDTDSQNIRFQWVPGPWTPCEHETCGYHGLQYREIRCQLPSGQPVLPANCDAKLRPDDAQECFKACHEGESPEREQIEYSLEEQPHQGEVILNNRPQDPDDYNVEWVVSQWSSCRLEPSAVECGRNNGIRFRNVTCERKDSRVPAEDYLCSRVEHRPSSTEPCELLCRQDCIVSLFSNWTSCDATCQITNRTRTRNVVVPPRHRGDHCPALSEMQPCDNCSDVYTFVLGDWGPCLFFGNTYRSAVQVHHIIGHQSRTISCLQSKGTQTTNRNCENKIPDVLLIGRQSCIIPQDCQVSTWSQLKPFNSSCVGPDGAVVPGFMIRTRQVLQLPMGNGLACPPNLVDMVPLSEKEDPATLKPCRRAKWSMSPLGVCESVVGYSNCGIGIQSSRAICVAIGDDGVERPVDESECPQPKPLVSQACHINCNWDCSVSQWSPWSMCENGACSESSIDSRIRSIRGEGQAGKRYRTREILTLPGPGSKGCPHLSETQACEPEPCFHWEVRNGDCEPTTRGGCGQGTRQRFAECVNREGVKVTARYCVEHQMDNRQWEDCHVPCPDDCVLSEWGSWSQCPDSCNPINRAPSTRTRTRRILAYSGSGPRSTLCPSQSSLRETEICRAPLECMIYLWKVSGWGPCSVAETSTKCGLGVQLREVACYSATGLRVVDQRCEMKVKPSGNQDCTVECPKDCSVTEWSEWSDCGTPCLAFTARQLLPKQRRQRFVVTYPQNGGLACPYNLFEERQCLNLPLCDTFFWDVSDWSGCILPPEGSLCGEGLQARNVTCRHANGTEFGLNICLEKLNMMPVLVEACYISCPTECQLTDWSVWSPCLRQGCEGRRFRSRNLLGDSKVSPKCRNINRFPLSEQEDCVCENLRPVAIGGWSDCILKPPEEVEEKFAQMSFKSLQHRVTTSNTSSNIQKQVYCGKGVRYMAIKCQASNRDVEGSASCSVSEYQQEECSIPCPLDCEMTEWTQWSQCSVTCGSGVQHRQRSIKTMPENGGRKCPALIDYNKDSQSRVCHSTCQYNKWHTDEWGPCMPNGGKPCGSGSRAREVICSAVIDGMMTLTPLDSSFCNNNDRPVNVQDCILPCPNQCVMSDWSEWTPCRQPCNGQQKQTRFRKVLRKPGGDYALTRDCTSQQEAQFCIRGANCIEYSWESSDWTSCLVNDGSEVCGVGHKERFPLCRNEAGERVDDYRCTELFGPTTEPLVVSCEIPCDNDCLLSDWSGWSPCSRSCGLGVTTRYRIIVKPAIGNGRKCPDTLRQSKPCFQRGCYKWLVTSWSTCRTQRGVCGSGIQERNVSCVGEDGLPVNSTRCPHDTEKLILKTRQSCRVSCPGECRLSEWSQWNVCYISCQDFEQGFRTGVRARSRAVLAIPSPGNQACDDSLWEEESCQTDRCQTFQWVAHPWDARKHRQVECQSSDGLVVQGGCDASTRPKEYLACNPPCTVPNSNCSDVDVCSCKAKFVAVYDNNTLVDCTMNTTTTTTMGAPEVEAVSTTSIWMYAVIAVGTVFVISVTAALYNMCELFRTGPRPRRKCAAAAKSESSTDVNGTRSRQTNIDTTNAKNAEIEELYKQVIPPSRDSQGRACRNPDPAYQNMDVEAGPKVDRVVLRDGRASGLGEDVSVMVGPAQPKANVGRSMGIACSPEERERLLHFSPPPRSHPYPCNIAQPFPQQCPHACSPPSSLTRSGSRRFVTPRNQRPRGRHLCQNCGLFSACVPRGSRVYEDDEDDGRIREVVVPDFRDSPRAKYLASVSGGGWGGGGSGSSDTACVEVHYNFPGVTNHHNCMLRESPMCSPIQSTTLKRSDRNLRSSSTLPSPGESRSPCRTSPTTISSKLLSSPPSTVTDTVPEEFELDNLPNLSLESAQDSACFKGDFLGVGNRGSLSNISEISFDKPYSDSNLRLGATADSLQTEQPVRDSRSERLSPLMKVLSAVEDTQISSRNVQDILSAFSSPYSTLEDSGDEQRPALYTDPRVVRLSHPVKEGSLDSGHSTLPPSRNGSIENPIDSNTGTSIGFKRKQLLQQDSSASCASVSSVPRQSNAAFRQSLENARVVRKSMMPVATQGQSPISPSAARPSSMSGTSPSIRQQRVGSRSPVPLSSPGSKSMCDSCRKVLGPTDTYSSDTPDSLSEMSDRSTSGMETTV